MNSHRMCNDVELDEPSNMIIDDFLENQHSLTLDWNSELMDSNFSYLLSFPCANEIENENVLPAATKDFEEIFEPSLPYGKENGVAISSPSNSSQTVPSVAHISSPLLDGHREGSSPTQPPMLETCPEEDMLEMQIKDIQKEFIRNSSIKAQGRSTISVKKEIQKPPTTAGITLDDLKAVFHLERPKAEKRLQLKRTTFSNLSRYYGISKWPFRTIRDAMNRMRANEHLLQNQILSKEKRRKLNEQQRLLSGVIDLIYSDPRESKDSNTLAVLLRIVAARENPEEYSEV